MTITTKSPIFLLDVAQDSAVLAELWDAIIDSPLANWEGEWLPELFKALQRLRQAGVDRRFWPGAAMNSAGPLMRLYVVYVVATNFDPEIARSTIDNYEPAEPLSLGALTAGGLAALWGWAATRLIAWPFSRRSRLRATRLKSQEANAG